MREPFEMLHGRGIKLALGSSGAQDEVKYYTALLGVGDLLEGSTSKHDAEHSKPSPLLREIDRVDEYFNNE